MHAHVHAHTTPRTPRQPRTCLKHSASHGRGGALPPFTSAHSSCDSWDPDKPRPPAEAAQQLLLLPLCLPLLLLGWLLPLYAASAPLLLLPLLLLLWAGA